MELIGDGMKKIKYIIITLLLSLIPMLNVEAAMTKVTCGNLGGVASKIPELTSYIVTIVQIAVPIVLVIMGTIDFIKGVTSQKDEEIKKNQQMFVKRLVVAAIVFFAVAIVKLLVSLVDEQNTGNIVECMDCFLSNECKPYTNGTIIQNSTSSNTHPISGMGSVTFDSNVVLNQINTILSTLTSAVTWGQSSSSTGQLTKAKNSILVGDSKTVQMCAAVTKSYNDCEYNSKGKAYNDDFFIASGGQGYAWFKNTAINGVNSRLANNNVKHNIIILMGVNDSCAPNVTDYAQKYFNDISSLAKSSWQNHNVIYVSVTPIIETSQHYAKLQYVRAFNDKMKSLINSAKISNFKYCDIYPTISLVMGRDSNDGLHYTDYLNKEVYNKVMNTCFK